MTNPNEDRRNAFGEGGPQGEEPWGIPQPLGDDRSLPSFPVEAMPAIVADWAEGISVQHQTPVDLAAMLALSVTAAAAAGKVQVELRENWVVQVNIYTITALASGEGKTPVFGAATEPLDRAVDELRRKAGPAIREAEEQRKVLTGVKERTEKKAVTTEDPAERESLMKELYRITEELEQLVVPPRPRLYTKEATPEATAMRLNEYDGRFAVLSDEGGEVIELMGRYSTKNKANLGVYLEGHDGGHVISDRVGRDTEDIPRATLTMGLTVQRSVVTGLTNDKALRGRGFLARPLYAMPTSAVGRRDTDPVPIPNGIRQRYGALIQSIAMAEIAEPITLRLTPAAQDAFRVWHRAHEPRLRAHHGDLAHLQDWGNKLPGQLGRLIGLLHVLSRPVNRWTEPVSVETVKAVLQIAEYLIAHARATFAEMGADPVLAGARAVIGWLRAKELTTISRRDCQRALPGEFKTADDVDPVLHLLVTENYLRPVQQMGHAKTPSNPTGAGRPRSPIFDVNPLVHSTDSTQSPNDHSSVDSVEGFGEAEQSGAADDLVDASDGVAYSLDRRPTLGEVGPCHRCGKPTGWLHPEGWECSRCRAA